MKKFLLGLIVVALVGFEHKMLIDYFYEEGTKEAAKMQVVVSTPPEPETKSEPAQREWKIQPGDTLRRLAGGFYADEEQWCLIASANGIKHPDRLQLGQKLVIPHQEPSSDLISNHDLVLASELC